MTEPHPFRLAAETKDLDLLRETLTEDVTFHSPVVFKSYEGREMTMVILSNVIEIFEDFRYLDEARGDGTVVQHPGYRDTRFAEPGHFASTVRGKTGSWHRPLAAQLNIYLKAGFELLRVAEDGTDPLPNQLAFLLRKPN